MYIETSIPVTDGYVSDPLFNCIYIEGDGSELTIKGAADVGSEEGF